MAVKTAKKVEMAKRRKRVAEELKAGKTYEQIAELLDVCQATICKDVKAILKATASVTQEAIEDWKKLQNMRIETMHGAVWEKAKEGDIQAITTVLKLMDRQARLLGLDAPIAFDWRSLPTDQLIELFNRLEGNSDAVKSGVTGS